MLRTDGSTTVSASVAHHKTTNFVPASSTTPRKRPRQIKNSSHRPATRAISSSSTAAPRRSTAPTSHLHTLFNRSVASRRQLMTWTTVVALLSILALSSTVILGTAPSLLNKTKSSFFPKSFFTRPMLSTTKSHSTSIRSSSSSSTGSSSSSSPSVEVNIVVVAPLHATSSLGPDWGTVLHHIQERLTWSDPGLKLHIVDATPAIASSPSLFKNKDIVVAVDVADDAAARALLSAAAGIDTLAAVGCTAAVQNAARIAGSAVPFLDASSSSSKKKESSGLSSFISSLQAALFPSARLAQQRQQAAETITELYHRHSSDDLLFIFLVLVNEAVRPIDAISNSTKRTDAGLPELQCMVSNCAKEMAACFTDSTCRTALNCMNGCSFNDQVCTYRCIASYESPQLEGFSFCIIQKHNCLGLDAAIPEHPNPAPMMQFGGKGMTHDVAEGLFIGWLKGAQTKLEGNLAPPAAQMEPFSWRVFAGKNPAYDYFPCQYQLFYPGKAKGSLWYQPVFKVLTLDGRKVWRERLYRVRRDQTPGTFFLSVLDNGVVSLERWSILDVSDELDWSVFYYRGAAGRAGLTYTGAVLASRDGEWPTSAAALERIEVALERAGIKMWELSTVSNNECGEAPLSNLLGPVPAPA